MSISGTTATTSSTTIRIRSPADPPSKTVDSTLVYTGIRKTIGFKHPGYPDLFGQNLLLQLYAWDHADGGVHAGTALLACGIIACNRWDGYLTVNRDGDPLQLAHDDILLESSYYYHLPNNPPSPSIPPQTTQSDSNHYRYPVYPSFNHWAFPHSNLPPLLRPGSSETGLLSNTDPEQPEQSTPSVSSISAAIVARDRACAISQHRDYIERAHLCPRAEQDWFLTNGMRQYNARRDVSGDSITDDMANAIAMRPDLHRAFDDCKFVLVPKRGQWVAHFLETTYELGRLYHNRPVQLSEGVSRQFILARFAWAIFPLVKGFMEHGPSRVVKVQTKSADGFQEEVVSMDRVGFGQLGAGRGRSRSPGKKRKATEADQPTVVEAKRHCLGEELGTNSGPIISRSHTPSLLHSKASCSDSTGTEPSTHVISGTSASNLNIDCDPLPPHTPPSQEVSEEEHIAKLRREALQKQRPTYNPALICCDYSLAERENSLGILGPAEFGGGHLCMECLGVDMPP